MPLWQWILDSAGILLLLVLLYGLALVLRRRALSRDGGCFELSHRARTDRPGRGWVLGLGRYAGDDLEWFRIFSLAPRPRRRWSRSELSYVGRREAGAGEQMALYADHVVVTLTSADGEVEMAMSPSSLMGFQSWLEAAPPGGGSAR
ncbi:DUF2550 domain-containing protein [Nocardioides donggukensis]|uniref:DUF2550 domain-containing protein n=1 Tax=Nocardioides donggukensis TaxID=2774019 RepID=A0A927K5C4_9ACTN|nr:DUF2550 domain-containing protein [Nocardioides donggukensis]MBD8870093.1 DUF2550 domain-containing protein [Nocardioides donggukensis]